MSLSQRTIYEFGEFRVDANRRLLLRAGRTVPLTPKNFDLLLILVQYRGQVLTKEELFRRVWPRTVVETSNLTQNIFVLRKLLGEVPNDHRFIVTAPGQGYRFVAPVREYQENEPDLEPQAQQPISIAVLPFKTISFQTEDQYLGTGVASSLINRLNRLSTIIVRPATSVLKYSDPQFGPQVAGQELGVTAVLDGTIRFSGSKIRVDVALIRVLDAALLWSGQFDHDFTDIFNTEDAIAEQVARALQVQLTRAETIRLKRKDTDDSEAYRLFIKGRYFWEQRTRNGLLKGIDYAQRALDMDPDYVRAYVGLADSYSLLGQYLYSAPGDAFPKAKAAAIRALELDESFAEAHASRAEVFFFYEWDWLQAESEYRRATELDPHYATARHWYAWFLMTQERSDEALVQIREAQRLDPGSLALATAVGLPLFYQREYEQAAEQYREVLEMDPNFTLAQYYLATSLLQLGLFGEAISSLRRVKAVEYQQQVTAQLGYAYARLGRRPEAFAMLQELNLMKQRFYVSPYVEAVVYAGLGETENAIARLEAARDERAPWMVFLQVDPCFDSLRSERAFRSLTRTLWS